MTPERIVIIGTSVGGVRAAQGLRAGGFTGRIDLVGAEDHFPYDKPPLSKQLLAGDTTVEGIRLAPEGDLESEGITLRLGVAASSLDTSLRRVELVDGTVLDYDALIIATGVRPRTLGAEPHPLIHTVRHLADVVSLREALSAGGPLVVVGGGFIGAEIASTAAALGVDATIVEALPVPFSRVLGHDVGRIVEQMHLDHGVEVVSGTGVATVDATGSGRGLVRLADGRELQASAVVAGIGCVPNTEWLASSGLPLDDGVVTNQHCRVAGVEGVYAIGDVARWFDVRTGVHRRVEHWTHASQQAQLVAHNILHPDDRQAHLKAPYFWSDQHGTKIQMAGRNAVTDDVEILRCDTATGKREVALYSNGERFTAGVAFGWPRVLPKLRQAWETEASLDEVRKTIEALSS